MLMNLTYMYHSALLSCSVCYIYRDLTRMQYLEELILNVVLHTAETELLSAADALSHNNVRQQVLVVKTDGAV